MKNIVYHHLSTHIKPPCSSCFLFRSSAIQQFVFVVGEGNVVESISCIEMLTGCIKMLVVHSEFETLLILINFTNYCFCKTFSNWVFVYSIAHLYNLLVHFYRVCNILVWVVIRLIY